MVEETELVQRALEERRTTQADFTVPASFLWGATISAHGHEGGDDGSDWAHWEQRPGRIADGSDSLVAVDHWNRFGQDFDLAAQLGLSALQVSLSWSRIEPAESWFDEKALEHYVQVLAAMRARNIEPLCVMHEHAVPAWFAKRGGWTWRHAPAAFAAYARRVADALGHNCRYWMPLCEPEHGVTMAFRDRVWPGAHGSLFGESAAVRNLLAAHLGAAQILNALGSQHRVGFSVRGAVCAPYDLESPWDLRRARAEQARLNHRMLRVVSRRGAAQFIGLSYYGRDSVRFSPWNSPPLRAIHRRITKPSLALPRPPKAIASGLLDLFAEFARYGLPLIITGNGIGTQHDEERCDFLLDHLHFVVHSMQNGMNIHGYFHLSLLDGFNWHEGIAVRTGLVHVDRGSLVRTPNKSAFLFRDICRSRSLGVGTIARYAPTWTPPKKENS